jgi:hypothetical protein
MAQWFVVITDVRCPFFRLLLEPQRAGANGDPIPVTQGVFGLRTAIDKDFVCAAPELTVNYGTVYEHKRTIVRRVDMRVIAGCAWIIKDNVIVWGTPDCALTLGNKAVLPLAAACIGYFKDCHDE